MHFLGSSAILSWNQPRLKINSLTFLQNEFSHSKCFQKAFFHGMGGKRFALARARMGTHPHSMKKSFLEKFKCENSSCKKSRNLSWVGSDFSLKCLNFPKNAWNFALVEIWSVFDNLDIQLLSNKTFYSWHAWEETFFTKLLLTLLALYIHETYKTTVIIVSISMSNSILSVSDRPGVFRNHPENKLNIFSKTF